MHVFSQNTWHHIATLKPESSLQPMFGILCCLCTEHRAQIYFCPQDIQLLFLYSIVLRSYIQYRIKHMDSLCFRLHLQSISLLWKMRSDYCKHPKQKFFTFSSFNCKNILLYCYTILLDSKGRSPINQSTVLYQFCPLNV